MEAMTRTPASPPKVRRRASKRERDPEDKRERILASARELFARQGYGATSTSQIARAAGVSEGVIFLHFESKQGVLRHVASDYGKALADHMREAFSKAGKVDAHAGVHATFSYVRKHGLLHQRINMAVDPADEAVALQTVRAEVAAMLRGVLEGWKESGDGSFDDAAMTATMLFGVVQTALFECFAREQGERESEWIALSTRWVRAALGMR